MSRGNRADKGNKGENMNKQKKFTGVVQHSRALSSEQKEFLIADPPLPEGYREKIAKILRIFDKQSKGREAYLRDKLDILSTEFIQQVEASDLDENEKKELLEKAKQIHSGFFPRNA